MDIDFVIHGVGDGCEGVGSAWAMKARPGDELGIIGPVGRPIREADWYLLGCDETGLPAASRILERMAPETRGAAFIEVANEAARQEISYPEGVAVTWIYRDGVPAGEHYGLVDAVARVEWPSEGQLSAGSPQRPSRPGSCASIGVPPCPMAAIVPWSPATGGAASAE